MGRKGMSGDQLNCLWKLSCYNRKLFPFILKTKLGDIDIYKCSVHEAKLQN